MFEDKLREINEMDDVKETAKRNGPEERLERAHDFNPDSVEKINQNLENKHIEKTKEVQELGQHEPTAYQQERRLEMASDFKELKETREKKSEIIEGMVTKYFPIASEKRLDNAKDFHYLSEKEFGEELRKRDPATTEQDLKLTDGFHDTGDRNAFIKDEGRTLVTAVHEKLHQKSISELPQRLKEGVTEYFAREKTGARGEIKDIDSQGREIPKVPSDYEKEVEIVGKLRATVGEKPLYAAYLDGKTEILKAHVDSILGDGAFSKISDALENRDYETASKIIEKYYKR